MTRDDETPLGSCATHPDKELWFAYGAEWERKAEAVRICEACPLLAPCREMALREWPLLAGGLPLYAVVGGLTERDIRRVRRGLEPLGVRRPGRPSDESAAPVPAARTRSEACECGAPHYSKGWCKRCYHRERARAKKAVC